MKRESTHKRNILKMLLDTRLLLTCTDFYYIANANQYFVELENEGLIKSEWGYKGNARVKLRFISDEYVERVEKYLGIENVA